MPIAGMLAGSGSGTRKTIASQHTENPGAKIGFLVLKNMFKGQQMKIEGLLAAIAH